VTTIDDIVYTCWSPPVPCRVLCNERSCPC